MWRKSFNKLFLAAATLALAAVLGLSFTAPPGSAQEGEGFEITWRAIGGSHGTSSGDGFELRGGVGLFAPGILSGGDFTLSVFPGGGPVLAGDVNGDREIDVRDTILVLRHTVGLITLTGDALIAADVNKDTGVNVADAVMILRHIAGLGSVFVQ